MLSGADLLAHITRLPHSRATFKQLVRELSARGEQRDSLQRELDRLAARGELIEARSGHYVVTRMSSEYSAGRLRVHRDGYAFVISDAPNPAIQGDIFIPPDSAQKAMNGDRVLARIVRRGDDGRAEGEIVRILQRAHQTVVGEFHVKRRGNWVEPFDSRIQQWIQIPEGLEIPEKRENVNRVGVKILDVASPEDLDGQLMLPIKMLLKEANRQFSVLETALMAAERKTAVSAPAVQS